MPAKKLLLNGIEVWVEVDALPAPAGAAPGALVERGAAAAAGEALADAAGDLRQLLAGVTDQVRGALAAAQPDSWSVELNVGFTGSVGVPVLAKGSANAAIKVTASWKKA